MAVKIIVPMPDFSLRKTNENEFIRKDQGVRLYRDVWERFPLIPPDRIEPRGLKINMHSEEAPIITTITPADWRFHKHAHDKSLIPEISRRVNKRDSAESFLNERHVEHIIVSDLIRRHIRSETALAALMHQRAITQRGDEARQMLKEGREHAIDKKVAYSERIAQKIAEHLANKDTLTQRDIFLQKQLKTFIAQTHARTDAYKEKGVEIIEKQTYTFEELKTAQMTHKIDMDRLRKSIKDEAFMFDLIQESLNKENPVMTQPPRQKILESYEALPTPSPLKKDGGKK